MGEHWFRFYDGVLDDPKVQQLPPGDFKHWVNFLCIASRHDGKLPPFGDLAFLLRIKEPQAEKLVQNLIARGLVDRNEDGSLSPHNWRGRQYKSDCSSDRVQRFRNGKRSVSGSAKGNVSCNGGETPPESETDTEKTSSSSDGVEDDELFEQLQKAAGGHCNSRDVSPIRALLSEGLDLQLIVSVIADRVPRLAKPLACWGAKWLVAEIRGASRASLRAVQTGSLSKRELVFIDGESDEFPKYSAAYKAITGRIAPACAHSPDRRRQGWYFDLELVGREGVSLREALKARLIEPGKEAA